MERKQALDSDVQDTSNEEIDETAAVSDSTNDRTIHTQSADTPVETLHKRWHDGDLHLQSDFQRLFNWDRLRCSRLIESALLELPLPVIYTAEEEDGRETVIDGQQRLTAFFSFLDGRLKDPQTGKEEDFRLRSLEELTEFNGKMFRDLSKEQQRRIRGCPLRTVTVKKGSSPKIKFEIFERLNQGSVALNEMELRNCMYRGPYMKLLKKLAADGEFRHLVGLKEEPHPRMWDVQLVLRFAAFYHGTELRYRSPMKRFFNEDMRQYQFMEQQQQTELRKAFRNAVAIVKSLFADRAFHRFIADGDDGDTNGRWEISTFNYSLYDVMMGVFHDKDRSRVMAALDLLREGIMDLMVSNEQFLKCILYGTSDTARVQTRFRLMRNLVDEIMAGHEKQPRLFTLQLKQSLYDADPTCKLCGNRIQHLDDAAVDHIEQYWRGGKTEPPNGRLTHRYCNWSRSRKD